MWHTGGQAGGQGGTTAQSAQALMKSDNLQQHACIQIPKQSATGGQSTCRKHCHDQQARRAARCLTMLESDVSALRGCIASATTPLYSSTA
jgi:hypothetical protein